MSPPLSTRTAPCHVSLCAHRVTCKCKRIAGLQNMAFRLYSRIGLHRYDCKLGIKSPDEWFYTPRLVKKQAKSHGWVAATASAASISASSSSVCHTFHIYCFRRCVNLLQKSFTTVGRRKLRESGAKHFPQMERFVDKCCWRQATLRAIWQERFPRRARKPTLLRHSTENPSDGEISLSWRRPTSSACSE